MPIVDEKRTRPVKKKHTEKSKPKRKAEKKLTPGMWVAYDDDFNVLAYGDTDLEAEEKASRKKPKDQVYVMEYVGEGEENLTVFGGEFDWHPDVAAEE